MYKTPLLLLFFCLLSVKSQAQKAANYVFATGADARLESSASGKQIIGPNVSLTAVAQIPIGFDIWFMGQRYTSFSVNVNGVIRLGNEAVVVTGNSYSIAGNARTAAFCGLDQDPNTREQIGAWGTSANGAVIVSVLGTAPSRRLLVEWKNLSINAKNGGDDATFQTILHESSPEPANLTGGKIEYRYGKVHTSVKMNSLVAGFGSGNSDGQYAGIDLNPATPVMKPSEVPTLASEIGPIKHLNSETAGQNRYFTFEPPVPNGKATNLNFCANQTDNSLTLNWNETATNHVGSVLFRSEDGQNFSFIAQTPVGSPLFTDTSVKMGKIYHYRVYTVSEGKFSELDPTGVLSVQMNPLLFPSLSDISVCQGQTATFSVAQGFDSYLWDSGETTRSISFAATADRTVKVTVRKGNCETTATATVKVNPAPTLTINGLKNVCEGACTELTAESNSANAEFSWSDGQTGSKISYCPSSAKTLIVTLTDRIAGCVLSDTVRLTIIKRPADLGNQPLQICENDSAILEGTAGYDRYEWKEILTGRKGNEQKFTVKNAGLYELTVFDDLNNCRFSDSITVNVNPLPVLFFTHDDIAFCENETYTLSAGNEYAAYEWKDATGRIVGREKTYTSNIPGAYVLSVKNAAGCSVSDSLKTRSVSVPKIRLEGPSVFCEKDSTLTIRAVTEADSMHIGLNYTWIVSAGSGATVNGSEITIRGTGTFRVLVRTKDGCLVSESKTVTSCCEGKVDIPNAFSPHNTPDNNLYRVEHSDLIGFKMVIYNRQGSPVFSSENPEDGWNGTVNGGPAPGGEYRVLIRAISCRNNQTFYQTLSSRLLLIE